MREVIQALLGCDWGRALSTEDDPEPCPDQAASIVVLYDDGEPVAEVKVCPKHKSRLVEETTPREVLDD